MPALSLFRRIASILAVSMLFAVVFPARFAGAGSTLHEGPVEFAGGTMENVTAGPDGLRLSRSGGVLDNEWTDLGTPQLPQARNALALAFDSASGETIMFGGECNAGPLNDTWTYEFAADDWILKNPAAAPSVRQSCGMVYDAKHDRTVLFGGWNGTVFLGDTWTYDLDTNIWNQEHPPVAPSARGNFVLAYDSADGVVVLFGGYDRTYLCETWTYDTGTGHWTQRHPAHAPSGLSDYAMAYDSKNGNVILFGGYNRGYFFNDTWAYNLSVDEWTRLTPSPAPSPRGGVSMAYDAVADRMVLFGKYDFSYAQETWTFDSGANRWTEQDPAASPSARVYYGITFDSVHDRVVLFGGGRDTVLGDLWTYDHVLDDWAQMHPSSGPPPRYWHAMAYDSAHGEIVLFGGYSEGYFLNDTWTYNFTANRWTDMDPSTAPSRRYGHGMAYDSSLGKVVLFGGAGYDGDLNDTWAYDRSTNEWTNMSPPASPEGMAYFSMVYDSVHGVMVLFGGRNYVDTWTYNLSLNRWTDKKPPTEPDDRWGNAMAFDALHQEMIIFGGYSHGSLVNDTWTYNFTANNWTDMNPPDAPSPRGYVSMAYDPGRNEVVLFGGWFGGVDSFGDTWTYDLATNEWTGWHPATSPPPRFSQAMVYNDIQEEVVLFGGNNNSVILGDTWAYNTRPFDASGAFTSGPHDSGGAAYFGTISWNASVPPATLLRFQLRCAATEDALMQKEFSGPDGTANSFYGVNNQTINAVNNGTRWFHYRAYFTTKDSGASPLLRGVDIRYNLLQEVELVSPAGGESWAGDHNITWSAVDKDHDALAFDIFLENGTASILLARDLPDGTAAFLWNTSLLPDGLYHIRIVARDDNPSIPLTVAAISGDFTIARPPQPVNHPPRIASTPSTNATMGVQYIYNIMAVDPDNDILTFSLYNPPAGMNLDAGSGMLSWTPSTTGTFTITVMVSDGRGGIDNQTFFVVVTSVPRPICTITYPMNGSTVSGSINITGFAVKGSLPLELVEVRIDGGDWKPATGLEDWKLVLDTRALTDGQHTIEARAFGGQLYSGDALVTITVNNAAPHVIPPNNQNITIDQFPWFILIIILIIAGVMVMIYLRSRRGQ